VIRPVLAEAAEWFGQNAIGDTDRLKFASSNARQLFHL
jgi:hypothetical protein